MIARRLPDASVAVFAVASLVACAACGGSEGPGAASPNVPPPSASRGADCGAMLAATKDVEASIRAATAEVKRQGVSAVEPLGAVLDDASKKVASVSATDPEIVSVRDRYVSLLAQAGADTHEVASAERAGDKARARAASKGVQRLGPAEKDLLRELASACPK